MQTQQVSNPASLVSTPSPAGKQPDANSSSAPFGQVLSREIAGRNASESARTQSQGAGNAHASREARRNDGNHAKPANAKSASEARAQDAAAEKGDVSDAATDPALQAPEDMLALVAKLNEMAAANVDTADTGAAELAQDAVAATTDPALMLAAAGNAIPADPLAAAPATTADGSAGLVPADDKNKPGPSFAALGVQGRAGNVKAQLDPSAAAKSDLSQEAVAGQSAGKPDLLAAASAAASSAATNTPAATRDFVSAMQESLSATTAGMAPPVQQAALHAAESMSPGAERLTPRVGTPAWDQALGQKVVWMVAGEQQSASLTLNPPDLGPLQVVLNVSNSQANATFIAAQPEVRQALEAALPKLREMLGEAGIQLGQASVNSGSPNPQGGFEHAGSSSHGSNQASHRGEAAAAEPQRASRVIPASSGRGMVDTFA